ncbi:hypothetical protein K1719_023968 [Acacia pycnantha]|nr:hypothetical protein K1719_023968 [Acacia pycnantha]
MLRNEPIPPEHVKVQININIDSSYPAPLPTKDTDTVGVATGNFVAWPHCLLTDFNFLVFGFLGLVLLSVVAVFSAFDLLGFRIWILHLLIDKGILISPLILQRTMTEEKYGGCAMHFLVFVLCSLHASSLDMG